MHVEPDTPRLVRGRTFLIAGLAEWYRHDEARNILELWEQFDSHRGNVPGQVGNAAYGVASRRTGAGFEYLAGVEVESIDRMPSGFSFVRIPESRYLVFVYRKHLSQIAAAFEGIRSRYLPESGYEEADTPAFAKFGCGSGAAEIWLPLMG